MIPGLPVSIADLTPPVLLGVTVLLILTGQLVPRTQVKRLETQIKYERDTADKQRETNATLVKALDKLTEVGSTVDHVMGAIQKNAEGSQ